MTTPATPKLVVNQLDEKSAALIGALIVLGIDMIHANQLEQPPQSVKLMAVKAFAMFCGYESMEDYLRANRSTEEIEASYPTYVANIKMAGEFAMSLLRFDANSKPK